MARAEYLKEQIKVGMDGPCWAVGCGFLLSVVVHVLWLLSQAGSVLPLALLSHPTDKGLSLGSRESGQRGAVGVCSQL